MTDRAHDTLPVRCYWQTYLTDKDSGIEWMGERKAEIMEMLREIAR